MNSIKIYKKVIDMVTKVEGQKVCEDDDDYPYLSCMNVSMIIETKIFFLVQPDIEGIIILEVLLN